MDRLKQIITGALPLLTVLPGLLAWLVEVMTLIAAVGYVLMAMRAAVLSGLYVAGGLLVLALLSVAVAMASSTYTNEQNKPNDTNN